MQNKSYQKRHRSIDIKGLHLWQGTAVLAGLALGGCQASLAQAPAAYPSAPVASYGAPSAPGADAPIPYAPADYAQVQPAAGGAGQAYALPAPAPVPAAYLYAQQGVGALQAETIKINERLQRIERALLRLDRRMQLVERNELNRMDGAQNSRGGAQAAYQGEGVGLAEEGADAALPAGYQAVAAQEPAITSTLQAASAGGGYQPVAAPSRVSAGLPSLADPQPAAGRAPVGASADLAIWTVRYDASKVWPSRAELPGSRDIVQALLQGNTRGDGITVFARGNKPTSLVFRDRVKALSRYLSKVTSRDSIAISALPAPHLDEDTIELFATH